jgi:hypothetical protein
LKATTEAHHEQQKDGSNAQQGSQNGSHYVKDDGYKILEAVDDHSPSVTKWSEANTDRCKPPSRVVSFIQRGYWDSGSD